MNCSVFECSENFCSSDEHKYIIAVFFAKLINRSMLWTFSILVDRSMLYQNSEDLIQVSLQ